MTGPNMPKAFCDSFGGNISLIMPRPCGSITAPNSPCTTRAAISISGDTDIAHSSDPRVKPTAPTRNIRRRP